MLVGERELRAFDAATLGAQKAGGEPDEARLAAAVGARDVQRLAGSELEVEPVEQQPPAAPQRDFVEAQQRATRSLLSPEI